jgi:serine/threonine protein phosphatase PrpC
MNHLPILATLSYLNAGERPIQEDHVLMLREKGIFLVADGFGGRGKVSVAQQVCESIQQFLLKEAGDRDATLPFVLRTYFSLVGNVLYNAVLFANQKLNAANQGQTIENRGGASVVGAFLDGHLLALASLGSCQAWLFRQSQRTELVTPRSLGRLKDPFARDPAADQRVPLVALGMTQLVEPEIFEYELRPGDWLLLATDGLMSEVLDQIQSIYLNTYMSLDRSDSRTFNRLGSLIQKCLSGINHPENVGVGIVIF